MDPPGRGQDYAGAVYGSLLAASVVAGAARTTAPRAIVLAGLLTGTGVVFWLAHVYSRLAGGPAPAGGWWPAVRAAAGHEWPVAEAALPPAGAALAARLVGLSDVGAAWIALIVAVAGQVGWAMIASKGAGRSWPAVGASAAGNLVLGLCIVALKVGLPH